MSKPAPVFHDKAADRTVRPFLTFLSHVSAENMARLFAVLVTPDRRLTQADRRLAEYVMDDASE